MNFKSLVHRLIDDMTIDQYHGTTGTYSSSQFKDLLDDEDVFIKKHIQKVIEREEIAAFDVGSYFHTGVLEPHKLKDDCIVYPGKVRRGKDWDLFKEKNKGKAIVTQAQKQQAEGLVLAVKDSPIAQEYLSGKPEVSLFVRLVVHEGQIYAPYFAKVLTIDGWVDKFLTVKDGHDMIVKVRADMLGHNYISDLKSTTGNARSNQSMRQKISNYHYDLSAALYLDMFGLMLPELREFVWIFASKDLYNAKCYRASSTNILVGRAKYMKAMLKMADCAANNWETVDYLDVLEPLPHELEYLRIKDSDLL
jgi:PDDEXK-like domain of unknown function (DUF3799)